MSTQPILTVDDYVKLPPVPATTRYAYGDDAEQFVDLYLPQNPPADSAGYPVLILLHGGCWGSQYSLTQLGQFSQHFGDLGIAVWSVEYRRIGNGGGWPKTFLDVATGADFLRTIAAEHALDLNRAIAVGHSAGGHLALWLAARHRLAIDSELYMPDPLTLTGVISLAGIPDLVDANAQNICRGAVPQLLGGSPDEVPDRYRDGSPHANLPLGVIQHLIIGDADHAVSVIHNQRYVKMARQQGDEVKLTVLPNVGHFEIVVPETDAWSTVEESVSTLLHASF